MLAFSERLEYYLESPCQCLYLEVFFPNAFSFKVYIKAFIHLELFLCSGN